MQAQVLNLVKMTAKKSPQNPLSKGWHGKGAAQGAQKSCLRNLLVTALRWQLYEVRVCILTRGCFPQEICI